MSDISIFGLTARIIASTTFPTGVTISAFADDADPLDSPDLEIASMAMGPNGDSVSWSRPELIGIKVNVIPMSQDDVNLTALQDANRTMKGKSSAKDTISITFTYPDGSTATCSDGKLVTAPVIQSGTSGGRAKSKGYDFRFGKITRTNATTTQ